MKIFKIKMSHGQEVPPSNLLTQMLREKRTKEQICSNIGEIAIYPDKFRIKK